MKKKIKYLKNIDYFATPVKTFLTSREKKTDSKSFSQTHGSILGGILTIIFAIISIYYSFNLFNSMNSGSQDSIKHEVENNVDIGLSETFKMTSHKYDLFYPLIQLENTNHELDFSPKVFEKSKNLNLKNVNKMIELSLTLKHRINSIDKYYKIPFKKCDLKDH